MWSKLKFFWISLAICPEHVYRIVAGNRSSRNVVQKCQLPGAPLFFSKQARILHCNRNLSRCRNQDIKIPLFEDELPVGIHRDHDSAGSVLHQDRCGDQALGGTLRDMRDSQTLARRLQVGADEQRFAGADYVLGESIANLSRAL